MLRTRRHFHSTPPKRQGSTAPDHYQILKVSPSVTPAELKRQFYVLSKETHPDLHPNDPSAGDRFSQISESYSILADPGKRKKYDRDVMRMKQIVNDSASRGYAGSRAPTGLSKRRGAFRGPPPSYYSQGNPSANTARQSEASSRASSDAAYQAGTFNASSFAPEGQYDPVFDPTKVYRTQTQEDSRRQTRRMAQMTAAQADAEDQSNFWVRFVVLTTIVVAGITVASMAANVAHAPRGGLVKHDGSRRDAARTKV